HGVLLVLAGAVLDEHVAQRVDAPPGAGCGCGPAGADLASPRSEVDAVVTFGYFLSSEDNGPLELVRKAEVAERHGFEALWISDHYHPWTDVQGQSPFVWSVLGALAGRVALPVTTAVTCPTVRIHPAVVAQ